MWPAAILLEGTALESQKAGCGDKPESLRNLRCDQPHKLEQWKEASRKVQLYAEYF